MGIPTSHLGLPRLSEARICILSIGILQVAIASGGLVAQTAGIPRYTLLEDLRIASDESSADKTLTSTNHLVVLRDGSIAVAQQQERTVRLYDPSGKFVRNIGRPGSGPGELSSLSAIGVVSDTIWIHSGGRGGRFALFSNNGDFLRNAMYTAPAYSGSAYAYLGNKRLFVVVEYQTVAPGAMRAPPGSARDSTHFVVTDSAQKPIFTVFKQERDAAGMIPFTDGTLRLHMEQPLMARTLWSVAPETGDIVVAIDPQFGGRPGVLTLMRYTAAGVGGRTEIAFPIRSASPSLVDSVRSLRGMRPPQTDRDRARRQSLLAAFQQELYVPSQLPLVRDVVAGSDRCVWLRDYFDPELWHIIEGNRVVKQVTVSRDLVVLRATSTQLWGVRSDSLGVATVYRYRVVAGS